MSLKTDAEAEIKRLEYLLENYAFEPQERIMAEKLLENAKKIRASFLTKAELKEMQKWNLKKN